MRKRKLGVIVFCVMTVMVGSVLFLRETSPKCSLGEYLSSHGFYLTPSHSFDVETRIGNEGYMTVPQARQFQGQLKTHPHINSVAEIGLNAGHSAKVFLEACKGLKKFTSFDINEYSYTEKAVEYFKKYYANCFEFVSGDSSRTVIEYAKKYPTQKFDLIYIDGASSFEGCLADLINSKELAHLKTTLWVNNFNVQATHSAVYTLINQGVLELDSVHVSNGEHGGRQWVKLRYRF